MFCHILLGVCEGKGRMKVQSFLMATKRANDITNDYYCETTEWLLYGQSIFFICPCLWQIQVVYI